MHLHLQTCTSVLTEANLACWRSLSHANADLKWLSLFVPCGQMLHFRGAKTMEGESELLV